MERTSFRSTSLVDIQAELHERELLQEARGRQRANRPHPLARTGLAGLREVGRRLLG